jgi:hypothetical protein
MLPMWRSAVLVETNSSVAIVRRPVGVLLRPDALRVRRAERVVERAREAGELVSAARGQPLAEAAVSPGRAEEWVDAVRADRDR